MDKDKAIRDSISGETTAQSGQEKMNTGTRTLGIAVIALLAINILTMTYLQLEIERLTSRQHTITAFASGTAALCVNNAPSSINNGTCNFTMPWGYNYTCRINATDRDIGGSIIFNSTFITNTTLFNITSNGTVNVLPSYEDIGNHTVRIYATDNSGCSNAQYRTDLGVEVIDSNHAPLLSSRISNISIRKDNVFALFLNAYFTDLDGDMLNYTVVRLEGNNITINIDNSSYTTITGTSCGNDYIYFIAEDPYGLTNTSNTIRVSVTGCPEEQTGDEGTGSGGGGGGGSYLDCTPEWRCGRWSECHSNNTQSLECKDYKGCNPRDLIRTFTRNCTYIPIDYTCEEDWECTEWGICRNTSRTRECRDKNSCGTSLERPLEKESCVPIASCFNGIQDGNETSIDCGGECGACKAVEMPTNISPGTNRSLIIAAIITFAFVTLILYSFRHKIARTILAIWNLRNHYGIIYINEEQKQKLLKMQYILQERYDSGKYDEVMVGMPPFMDEYFKVLTNAKNIAGDNIGKHLKSLKNAALEKILKAFYLRHKVYIEESHKSSENINAIGLQRMLDELLSKIYLISEFTDKDALICIKERIGECKTSFEEWNQVLSNIYIALEFTEIPEARRLYKRLLDLYDRDGIEEKRILYPEMMRILDEINYVISIHKK